MTKAFFFGGGGGLYTVGLIFGGGVIHRRKIALRLKVRVFS